MCARTCPTSRYDQISTICELACLVFHTLRALNLRSCMRPRVLALAIVTHPPRLVMTWGRQQCMETHFCSAAPQARRNDMRTSKCMQANSQGVAKVRRGRAECALQSWAGPRARRASCGRGKGNTPIFRSPMRCTRPLWATRGLWKAGCSPEVTRPL